MTAPDIEAVKAYWDARPCNVRHSDKPIGSLEYFNEVDARKYFVEPHILGFAQFDRWKGKSVLEIGCGIGTDAVNFAIAGAHYSGIDLSRKSVEIAVQRFDVYGLTGIFYTGNAEELTKIVPVKPFDLVYAFGSIHHCPHPEKVISEVRSYMAPGSEFRLMLYAHRSWKRMMIDAGYDQPEAQPGCPIARTYTEQQARDLLEGFNIIEMKQDHIFPYNVEKYKQHEYEVLPCFKSMPPELFHTMEQDLGWHMLIRCTL